MDVKLVDNLPVSVRSFLVNSGEIVSTNVPVSETTLISNHAKHMRVNLLEKLLAQLKVLRENCDPLCVNG